MYQKNAIEMEPNDHLHYASLSTIYYLQEKKNLAVEQLVKADKIINEDDIHKYAYIYLSLGELNAELGNYGESIESYIRLIAADRDNYKAHLGLARVYERAGEKDLAVQEYSVLAGSGITYFENLGTEGIKRLKERQPGAP